MSYGLAASARYKIATLGAGDTIVDLGSPLPFPVLAAGDITVTRVRAGAISTLTLDVHYSVSLLDQLPGARVTLAAPALAGDIIQVVGQRPIARPTDLNDGQKFNQLLLNAEFDHIAIALQEARRDIERSWKAKLGVAGGEITAGATGTLALFSGGNLVEAPITAADVAAVPGLAAQVAEDRVQTGLDRVQTGLDRTETSAALEAMQDILLQPQQYRIDVRYLGLRTDGESDNSAALAAVAGLGLALYWPEGDYHFGSNVDIRPLKDIDWLLHPRARIFTKTRGQTGSLIAIQAPDGGVGLPARRPRIMISGGYWDSSNLAVGSSVPYADEWPPPEGLVEGSGGATIYVDGQYNSGGWKNAFRKVLFENMEFYAGDHWTTAGGDSCTLIGSADFIEVKGCIFRGGRDNGIYVTSNGNGVTRCRVSIHHNYFEDCFNGVFAKRSLYPYSQTDNHFKNCIQGGSISLVAGDGARSGVIADNIYENVTVCIRMTAVKNFECFGNVSYNAGSIYPDGTRIAGTYGLYMIWLPSGGMHNHIHDNTAFGMDPTWVGESTTENSLVKLDHDAQRNRIHDNVATDSYLYPVTEDDDASANYNEIGLGNYSLKEADTAWRRRPYLKGLNALNRQWELIDQSVTDVPHTGTTSTTQILALAIPSRALGPNGHYRVRAWFTCTNNANNKTAAIRLGGSEIYATQTVTTVDGFVLEAEVINLADWSSQKGRGTGREGGVTSAFDTRTTEVSVAFRGTLGNAADTITLKSYTVEMLAG